MDVTIKERALLLNIILIDSATCLKKRREKFHSQTLGRPGAAGLLPGNSTVPQAPRDFQIAVLGPEAEESLDGGQRRAH